MALAMTPEGALQHMSDDGINLWSRQWTGALQEFQHVGGMCSDGRDGAFVVSGRGNLAHVTPHTMQGAQWSEGWIVRGMCHDTKLGCLIVGVGGNLRHITAEDKQGANIWSSGWTTKLTHLPGMCTDCAGGCYIVNGLGFLQHVTGPGDDACTKISEGWLTDSILPGIPKKFGGICSDGAGGVLIVNGADELWRVDTEGKHTEWSTGWSDVVHRCMCGNSQGGAYILAGGNLYNATGPGTYEMWHQDTSAFSIVECPAHSREQRMWDLIGSGDASIEDLEDLYAAKLSAWMYDNKEADVSEVEKPPSYDSPGCRIVPELIGSHDKDPYLGLMCRVQGVAAEISGKDRKSSERVLFVAWMGTTAPEHWLMNVNVEFSNTPFRSHDIAVHSAYWSQAEKYIEYQCEDFWAALKKAKCSKIIFTGHSMGGAMATLTFTKYILSKAEHPQEVKHLADNARLVTFAAPQSFRMMVKRDRKVMRPGEAFLRAMALGRVYMHNNDPVPRAYCALKPHEAMRGIWEQMKTLIAGAGGMELATLRAVVPGVDGLVAGAAGQADEMIKKFIEMRGLGDIEDMAVLYRHFCEVRVLKESKVAVKSWADYTLGLDVGDEHHIDSYICGLGMSVMHADAWTSTRFTMTEEWEEFVDTDDLEQQQRKEDMAQSVSRDVEL